jgi:hypothetical protein
MFHRCDKVQGQFMKLEPYLKQEVEKLWLEGAIPAEMMIAPNGVDQAKDYTKQIAMIQKWIIDVPVEYNRLAESAKGGAATLQQPLADFLTKCFDLIPQCNTISNISGKSLMIQDAELNAWIARVNKLLEQNRSVLHSISVFGYVLFHFPSPLPHLISLFSCIHPLFLRLLVNSLEKAGKTTSTCAMLGEDLLPMAQTRYIPPYQLICTLHLLLCTNCGIFVLFISLPSHNTTDAPKCLTPLYQQLNLSHGYVSMYTRHYNSKNV